MEEEREIKNKCMSKMRSMIVLGLVISVLVIAIRVIFVIFWGPPKETVVDYFETIDDAIKNILIPLLGIGVTAVLSYMIWRANSKSADIATKMHDQEEEQEKEIIAISANKIFFSMISAYEYLHIHYKNTSSIRSVFICQDWLDELSRLKSAFTYKEMKSMFDLFRDIDVLVKMEKHEDYQKTLDPYCEDRLITLLENCNSIINFEIEDYFKMDDWIIMHKLRRLREISLLEEVKEIKKISHSPMFEKKYTNDQTKYCFNFINNDEYKIQVYRKDGEIIADGVIQDKIFNGYMKKYDDGKLIEQGDYVDGNLFDGEKYHVYAGDPFANEEDEIIDYGIQPEEYYKVQKIIKGKIIVDNDPSNIEWSFDW